MAIRQLTWLPSLLGCDEISARIQSLSQSQTQASTAAFELFVNGDGVNPELIS